MSIDNIYGRLKNKINELSPYFREAYKIKGISQIYDIILHKILINTSPIDYYRYGFYKKNLTWDEKSYYVGKRGSRYFPWEVNPIKYVPVLDNKFLFKTLLKGFELPQPKLISVIGQDYEINTKEKFYSLMHNVKSDMVFKPLDGSGGRGVKIIENRGGKYYDNNKLFAIEDIWQYVSNDNYLLEERVKQIDSLSSIHPSSLNTIRIITLRDKDNKYHILIHYLRVGCDGKNVDNAGQGGIIIFIDDSGSSYYAYNYKKNLFGMTHHPDTGVSLLNIKIDQFDDIIDLVLRASHKFSFIGTIGWDIALSNDGPLIIEANPFYDALAVQIGDCGSMINSETAKVLRKHNIFTLYDKTMIHPNFNRDRILA